MIVILFRLFTLVGTLSYFTVDTKSTMDTITIPTQQGKIKGLHVAVPVIGYNNEFVYQFRKIPYAIPPVGDLRFAEPIPHPVWNNTLDATEFGAACMQEQPVNSGFGPKNIEVSEDCLFLNVYAPRNFTSQSKISVMVWIHGGGFKKGTAVKFDGSYLTLKGNVIVVTVNYRLGIFGFFTLGNSAARGNYGLLDQIMAFRWVNKNIASFGGDPNSVTIFGESAGGISVSLQSLIPINKGLFHRVIAESGAANSVFGTSDIGLITTNAVGVEAGCIQKFQDPAFLKCMREKSPETLINATLAFVNLPTDGIHFLPLTGPVIDNYLLHDSPASIITGPPSEALDFFRSLDIIVGNCNEEGTNMLSLSPDIQHQFHFNLSVGIPYEVFSRNIVGNLTQDYFYSNKNVSAAICEQYCVQNNISQQSRSALDMYSDLFFVSPAVQNLNKHISNISNSKQYQYIFSRRIPNYGAKRPDWFRGAGHSSELIYLFGINKLTLRNITVLPEDYKLAARMMTYWTNFAKTGSPNAEDDLPFWPEYDVTNKPYIQLDTNITTGERYRNYEMNFWLVEIPGLLHPNNTSK